MSLYAAQAGAVGSLIADSGQRGLHDRGGCGGLVNSNTSPKRSPLEGVMNL